MCYASDARERRRDHYAPRNIRSSIDVAARTPTAPPHAIIPIGTSIMHKQYGIHMTHADEAY